MPATSFQSEASRLIYEGGTTSERIDTDATGLHLCCLSCGGDIDRVVVIPSLQTVTITDIGLDGTLSFDVDTEEPTGAPEEIDGDGEWYCGDCGIQGGSELLLIVKHGAVVFAPALDGGIV